MRDMKVEGEDFKGGLGRRCWRGFTSKLIEIKRIFWSVIKIKIIVEFLILLIIFYSNIQKIYNKKLKISNFKKIIFYEGWY
jgi:hypothetical protein